MISNVKHVGFFTYEQFTVLLMHVCVHCAAVVVNPQAPAPVSATNGKMLTLNVRRTIKKI